MQEQEIEVADPMCYECHREIKADFHAMCGKRVIFYFCKAHFYEYLDKFKREHKEIQTDI